MHMYTASKDNTHLPPDLVIHARQFHLFLLPLILEKLAPRGIHQTKLLHLQLAVHGGESRALVNQLLLLLSDQLAAPLLGLMQQLLLTVPVLLLVLAPLRLLLQLQRGVSVVGILVSVHGTPRILAWHP